MDKPHAAFFCRECLGTCYHPGEPSDAERLLRELEPNLFPKKTDAARLRKKASKSERVALECSAKNRKRKSKRR